MSPARRGGKAQAFASAARFRAWLERNHTRATELEVRLFKRHAAHLGMGYLEALDEALCFGWIDGVTHSIDADSYQVRFTPRRPGSRWSLVNIRKARRLEEAGRMHAAGLAAFRARDEQDARRYSFESRATSLSPAFIRKFRARPRAWAFFQAQAPWYRRTLSFWVMSAKRPETRERRLADLIDRSVTQTPIRALAGRPVKRTETRARGKTVKNRRRATAKRGRSE